MRKPSPGQKRVVIYLNRPRKRAQRLEKRPGYPPIFAKSFDMRKSPHLRMRVQSYT